MPRGAFAPSLVTACDRSDTCELVKRLRLWPRGAELTDDGLVGKLGGVQGPAGRETSDVDAGGVVDLLLADRQLPLQKRVPKADAKDAEQVIDGRNVAAPCSKRATFSKTLLDTDPSAGGPMGGGESCLQLHAMPCTCRQ